LADALKHKIADKQMKDVENKLKRKRYRDKFLLEDSHSLLKKKLVELNQNELPDSRHT